jgi:hypothetical protein
LYSRNETAIISLGFEAGGVVDEELAAAEVPGLPNSQEFSEYVSSYKSPLKSRFEGFSSMKDPIELIQETVKNLSAEAAAHPKVG